MKCEYPNLPLIQERFVNNIKASFVDVKYFDCEVCVFIQTWGSTALGFGGIGGQAMTSAYTTVIWDYALNVYGVFFGDRLAYVVKNPNELFFADLKRHRMKDRCNFALYIQHT